MFLSWSWSWRYCTEAYSEAPLPATEATLPGASEISEISAQDDGKSMEKPWKTHGLMVFSMVFPIEIIEH